MATKKEEAMQKAMSGYQNFISLCRTFFGKNPIDNVTALDKDSEFYKTAQDIANEFEMDWENLSQEDSNEITIALLEDYYNRVNVSDNMDIILNITIKDKKAKKAD